MEPTVDIDALNALVESKHLTRKEHLDRPGIFIYNYTPLTQYDKVWNELTMMSRGLVVGSTGKIIARPLKKFFNFEEHNPADIPWHLPFEVTTKMDGSMLIVQPMRHGPNIYATRGSFMSDQAVAGMVIFEINYKHVQLDPDYTYIFEVIYPDNRIVVNYGDMRDIVLLAMIHTATGEELPLSQAPAGLNVVKTHHFEDMSKVDSEFLKSLEKQNMEGFVVHFDNGFRVKVKFEDYKRLHRVITGVSTKTIWEFLRDDKDIAEILEHTPDEFNEFVRRTQDELMKQYWALFTDAEALYLQADKLLTRKEQALFIQDQTKKLGDSRLLGIVFAMLDGKNPDPAIWKHLQPEYRQPFADRD